MSDKPSNLPALAQRTVTESEYRALEARARRVDELERRVAELEQALGAAAPGAPVEPGSTDDLVAGLLPVLDGFAAALASARARQSHAAILEGVELVEREMGRVLERFGLERIAVAAGDAFDFSLHETLQGLDALVAESPSIAEELRPGYRRRRLVLRRAIVRIAD